MFTVTYRLATGDTEEAKRKAADICLEQTVEFPADLLPSPASHFFDNVIGKLASLAPDGYSHLATIMYPVATTADEMTQFLNVLFGNISIKPGIRVEQFSVPQSLATALHAGPRFGIKGLRELLKVPSRPLLSTALKPMGLSAKELAELAYKFAVGGVDLIKDDHGLTSQHWAPFEERVRLCSEAVARANAETGRHCVYCPNVTGAPSDLKKRCQFAKSVGAGGLLIAPMLTGLGAMHEIATDDSIGLPILAHPAFLGTYCMSPSCGMSHKVLFGQLMRMLGADIVIFPSFDGRFSFSKEECASIDHGCKDLQTPSDEVEQAFPCPAGGMTLPKIQAMHEVYGNDVVYLIGSGLFRNSPDVVANCKQFHTIIESLH